MFNIQILKNTFWTIADLTSYPLVMILVTPFFITHLGPEKYGLWMLVNVLVQALNVLNFGLGEATIKAISSDVADTKKAFLKNSALAYIMLLGCVIIGVFAGFVIHQYTIFNISPSLRNEAAYIVFLFACVAGVKFLEIVNLAVFKGLQRFDIAAKLVMCSRLSGLTSAVVVVSAGFSLFHIALAMLALGVINILIQHAVLYSQVNIKIKLPNLAKLQFSEIYANNFWYWLQGVIALLGFLSDRIFIGIMVDLKTVGYYSVAALVGSQIHNVLLTFGGFVFPKVVANQTNHSVLLNTFYLYRAVIAGLGWLVVMLFFLFGDIIFSLWLGAETYAASAIYIKPYLVFIAFILLIIIPYHFINGSAHVKLNSLFEIMLRVLNFVGMIVGYCLYGMNGLIWGLIITTLINLPVQYFVFYKKIVLTFPKWEWLVAIVPAFAVMGLAMASDIATQILFCAIFVVLYWFIYGKKALPLVLNFIHEKR